MRCAHPLSGSLPVVPDIFRGGEHPRKTLRSLALFNGETFGSTFPCRLGDNFELVSTCGTAIAIEASGKAF
jgi:hypothetical protein